MQSKLLHDRDGHRTFVLVLEQGDEFMESVRRFAQTHGLSASQFTAIGAFERAVLAFFDYDAKEYRPIPVAGQAEVLALVADVSCEHNAPKVHAHVVVGLRDGTTRGGHVSEGHVRPTLEIVLTESPGHLERRHDEKTGLSLIRLN